MRTFATANPTWGDGTWKLHQSASRLSRICEWAQGRPQATGTTSQKGSYGHAFAGNSELHSIFHTCQTMFCEAKLDNLAANKS